MTETIPRVIYPILDHLSSNRDGMSGETDKILLKIIMDVYNHFQEEDKTSYPEMCNMLKSLIGENNKLQRFPENSLQELPLMKDEK